MTIPFDHRSALEDWLPFELFARIATSAADEANENFFLFGGNTWLRDAALAVMYGDIAQAKKMRLISRETGRPDFEVMLRSGIQFSFECTEVVRKTRGTEIKAWIGRGRPRAVSEGDWSPNRALIEPALLDVVSKKIKRSALYPQGTSLLIYFNLATYGNWDDYVEDECLRCTVPARKHFKSIWVLWGNRLLRCWPDPFKRRDYGLRSERHELGRALRCYESTRLLNDLFASDRMLT